MEKKIQSVSVDRKFWNIVKGIGIILVVVGHIDTPATNYIYLFHMPLFFFVSGYLYNEEKYGDNPYLNIVGKLRGSWMKYVGAYFCFILLHNVFYKNGILEPDAKLYSLKQILIKMSEALLGTGSEFLAGPLWFVPVSVIASCMLGVIVSCSRCVGKRTQISYAKYIVQFILMLLCTIAGYYMMKKHIDLAAHMQISFVVMPCLWGGYLLRSSNIDFNKYLNPLLAIICGVLVFVANLFFELELVLFMKVYPLMHVVAFLGIYMILYIAKLFSKNRFTKMILDWSGQASFFIMAVHYAIFRLFDWGMAHVFYSEDPYTKYLELPNAFPNLWGVYLVIGYVIPVVVYVIYVRLKEKLFYGKENLEKR